MYTNNHNHMSYSSRDTKWDRIFCHFGPFFALLTPSPINNPQNQNLKEMKKASGDVIILNWCNKKTRSHDVYLDRYGMLALAYLFCHFRPFFAFLLHYWPQKLKFGKNVKKTPRYIILLKMWSINQDHKMLRCLVPEIWSSTDRTFL